jgi:hypothetical protein
LWKAWNSVTRWGGEMSGSLREPGKRRVRLGDEKKKALLLRGRILGCPRKTPRTLPAAGEVAHVRGGRSAHALSAAY